MINRSMHPNETSVVFFCQQRMMVKALKYFCNKPEKILRLKAKLVC